MERSTKTTLSNSSKMNLLQKSTLLSRSLRNLIPLSISTKSNSSSTFISTKETEGTITELTVIKSKAIELKEKIGEGEFNNIYLGTWNNKSVALKKIKNTSKTGYSVINFQNEISILSKLNSPHVIKIYGYNAKKFIIVMKYYPQGSLLNHMHLHPTTSWKWRWQWAIGIVQGLIYLHQNNIVHCDLACRNILLDNNNQIKISDFGLASIGSSDQKGLTTIAFQWAAPEYFNGHKLTSSFDIYSFAIVLWEIATNGLPPLQEKLDKISLQKTITLRQYKNYCSALPNTTTPKHWKRIFNSCKNAEPEKRPSAQVLLEKFTLYSPAISEKFPIPASITLSNKPLQLNGSYVY